MNQRTRERIALVAFLIVVAVAVCGSVWYLNVGRQFNKTAIFIDDATGSLEDYQVLVYEGVATPTGPEARRDLKPRTSSSVVAEYEAKNADVLELDVLDPSRYRNGQIVRVGARTVGIVSVLGRGDASRYQNVIAAFKEHVPEGADPEDPDEVGVDVIVCITPDPQLLNGSAAAGDVDIFVETMRGAGADVVPMGSAYCVKAPAVGKVGVMLISPSGIVSSKEVSGS